jgi:hypothetical protein
LSYAEVKALATGNPLLMELAEANAQVTRLRHLATAHTRATRRLEGSVSSWRQQIAGKTRLAGTCERIAATCQGRPDPAWRDHLGNVIPGQDVPAILARLAREAMASAGYGAVSWRGLHISFSAERKWRQIIPVATISAASVSLPVELNAAWTVKGQHWRIEKEITSCAGGAAAAAGRLRSDVEDLQQRVADTTRRIGEPFPQAAELEAARARRDAIEQDIRAAAAPQDDADAAPGHDEDLADAALSDAIAIAGMQDAQEVTFTPAVITPGVAVPAEHAREITAISFLVPPDTAELPEDTCERTPTSLLGPPAMANLLGPPAMADVPSPPATPDLLGPPRTADLSSPPGTAELPGVTPDTLPIRPPVPAAPGDGRAAASDSEEAGPPTGPGRPGELLQARSAWSGSRAQQPAHDVVTVAGTAPVMHTPARPAAAHPARVARLDGAAEPLFPWPAAAGDPPISRASRARQATWSRSARRKATRAAARDSTAQLALFDLPPSPVPAPARRGTPVHSRSPASRK